MFFLHFFLPNNVKCKTQNIKLPYKRQQEKLCEKCFVCLSSLTSYSLKNVHIIFRFIFHNISYTILRIHVNLLKSFFMYLHLQLVAFFFCFWDRINFICIRRYKRRPSVKTQKKFTRHIHAYHKKKSSKKRRRIIVTLPLPYQLQTTTYARTYETQQRKPTHCKTFSGKNYTHFIHSCARLSLFVLRQCDFFLFLCSWMRRFCFSFFFFKVK